MPNPKKTTRKKIAKGGGETHCLPILWQASENHTSIIEGPGLNPTTRDYSVHNGRLISIILPTYPLHCKSNKNCTGSSVTTVRYGVLETAFPAPASQFLK